MMHGTRIPLRTWVLVFFEMAASKNGVAALEIERKYGLCARSAWFMLHRIRETMRSGSTERFVGTVMADEAYIGGDPKNRHAWKKVAGKWEQTESKDGRGTDKTPVVSLVNAATGEVRSRVVTNVDGMTLGRFILENADPTGSTLVTDSFSSYGPIGEQFAKHETLDHTAREYVRDGFTTNRVECFYSQLKRSIDRTHHHVSEEHLHRYVGEHDFRYSTCTASDADRMARMVEQVEGRRLIYKRVKA
jgi:transposase-like protein